MHFVLSFLRYAIVFDAHIVALVVVAGMKLVVNVIAVIVILLKYLQLESLFYLGLKNL